MELVRLVLAIGAATFIGWNILYLFSFKRDRLYILEKAALSYGLGFGFISLEMFVFYFLNIKFSISALLMPWTALLILNLIFRLKNGRQAIAKKTLTGAEGNRFVNVFLLTGISFEALYAIFRALIKPIESYDAIAIYAIKAKIFYLARSIPQDFFYNLGTIFPHPDYPLNIPLSETFIYLFLGNFNDQLVKIIFPLFFLAVLIILYYGIRRFADNKTYALAFTFILASVPQFNAYATNAYVDLVLAYYACAAAIYLTLWLKDRSQLQFFYISALMLALSGWTKNEGLMYCAAFFIVSFLFLIWERAALNGKTIFHIVKYFIITSVISLPWLYVRKTFHLVNSDISFANANPVLLSKQLYKIWPIVYEFQRQVFGPKKWNLIWILFLFVLIVYRKRVFEPSQKYITMLLIFIISGYVLAYILADVYIGYLVTTTWSRFLVHFLPIVVFLIALILKEEARP